MTPGMNALRPPIYNPVMPVRSNVAYCVAGKVNSTDKLDLVIESVRLDTKRRRSSSDLAPAGGAGCPAVR